MTEHPSAPAINVQSPVGSLQSLARSPPPDGVIVTRDVNSKGALENARPTGKAFPGKLIRTLSGNPGSNQAHQNGIEGRRLSGSGPALDPIGKQIQQRSIANGGLAAAETAVSDGTSSPTTPQRSNTETTLEKVEAAAARDAKKNRASFLSRFIAKKKDSFDTLDDEEEGVDKRTEGANAETFSQPLGYMPKYPEPPKYIKVRAKGKKDKDFDRVFLAQELRGRTGVEVAQAGGRKINPAEKAKLGAAVWALEFSKDGRYLAAGGHDHLVRVWKVLETEEERNASENQSISKEEGVATTLSAPVFQCKPVQEYEGHTSTIVALSWSKNNFLLSSSMDKTVRLWHVSRSECLCAFKHSDFVTSIQFHPRDDRFFLAGSMDSKLRLWSIPDKSVAHWTQCNEIITSVAFTPDGKTSIAGCLSGLCIFYETEGFRQQTQMHVKSTHGKNSKGSKITGIQAINYPPSDPNGDVKLLITSNDSRIRLYNFRDKGLELKFRGAENASSQIKASFSDDGRYIITGSEDKKAYIWTTEQAEKNKDRYPVEMFEAHGSIVTGAVMAPAKTRQLLQQSGDPLFDLCNPPPVQLVSRAESRSSAGGRGHSPSASKESIRRESIPEVPETPTSLTYPNRPRPEDNPGWLARSSHSNGNVIVTADFEGHIKVFRQDCAHKQRLRNNENWDAGSTISKKLHLHRSSSIATRNSVHSAREPDQHHHHHHHILSWRQSIDRPGTTSTGSPFLNGLSDSVPPTPARKNFSRSISPAKSKTANSPALSSTRSVATPQASSAMTPTAGSSSSPAIRGVTTPSASSSQNLSQFPQRPNTTSPPAVERRSPQANANALMICADGTSDSLFQRDAYEAQANALTREHTVDIDGRSRDSESRQPSADARATEIKDGRLATPSSLPRGSRSSIATGSTAESASEQSLEESEEDEDEERCQRCGGDNFRMKKRGGDRVMECVNCGKALG